MLWDSLETSPREHWECEWKQPVSPCHRSARSLKSRITTSSGASNEALQKEDICRSSSSRSRQIRLIPYPRQPEYVRSRTHANPSTSDPPNCLSLERRMDKFTQMTNATCVARVIPKELHIRKKDPACEARTFPLSTMAFSWLTQPEPHAWKTPGAQCHCPITMRTAMSG